MNYRILKTVALMSIMFGVTIIFSAGGESGNAAAQSFKRSSVDRAGAAPEHGRAIQVTTHVDDTGSAAGKTIEYAENLKPRVPTATQTADEKSPAETGTPAVDQEGPAENRD